jgi:hypothetical protein
MSQRPETRGPEVTCEGAGALGRVGMGLTSMLPIGYSHTLADAREVECAVGIVSVTSRT